MTEGIPEGMIVSDHARKRMNERGLDDKALEMAFNYGRPVYTRRSYIYVIGKKEIKHAKKKFKIDLQRYEGVQVVVSIETPQIITVYRNKDFRTLKPKTRRIKWAPQHVKAEKIRRKH